MAKIIFDGMPAEPVVSFRGLLNKDRHSLRNAQTEHKQTDSHCGIHKQNACTHTIDWPNPFKFTCTSVWLQPEEDEIFGI